MLLLLVDDDTAEIGIDLDNMAAAAAAAAVAGIAQMRVDDASRMGIDVHWQQMEKLLPRRF